MKKTKILATIGPASMEKKMIVKMLKSGMNAIRINTSHGDPEQYDKIIDTVKSVADLPVIFDTQGPEFRIQSDRVYVVTVGDRFRIGFDNTHKIFFNKNFFKDAEVGKVVLLDDGLLIFKIVSKKKRALDLVALSSGKIFNRVRVNLPFIDHNLDILSKNDKSNLKYAIAKSVDYIALSYTRNAKDVKYLKEKIKGTNIDIIAKIENSSGVENFDEILEQSDGIMVARGDLGVEISSAKLPIIQKEIIKKCNQAGKLVITATQMLQSMVESPVPTRAETSDVANAILDGTDVVMLSGETAKGKYPVHAVKEMRKIALEVESEVNSKVVVDSCSTISEAISKSIYDISQILPISKIVTLTHSGYTAKIISRFRLGIDVIAVTDSDHVKRELDLYFGVRPFILKEMMSRDRIKKCADKLYKKSLLKKEDLIIFTAGVRSKEDGGITNLIEIHKCVDLIS